MEIQVNTKIIKNDVDPTTFPGIGAARCFQNSQQATDSSANYQVEKVIDASVIITSTGGTNYTGSNQETLNNLILSGDDVVGLYVACNDITPETHNFAPVQLELSIGSLNMVGSEFSIQNLANSLFTSNTVKVGNIIQPPTGTVYLLTILIFIK